MALQFRPTFDGSQNDLTDPLENAAGQPLDRMALAHFADGISTLRPEDVNSREVSNIVFGQADPNIASKFSSLWAVMGQFVDHDLDLVRAGGADISIQVPVNDVHFQPGSFLSVTRAQTDPTTGAGTTHPAAAINSLSGWLDLSQVFGSSQATADSLRSHEGGHLLTSPGDNLPMPGGRFVAGDIRVGENDYLTSIQTLFLREHNHQADRVAAENPAFSDEQIFQTARAWTTAEYQNILESEFLPVLLGTGGTAHFTGYNPAIDATIPVEFAGAVFRYGHSTIEPEIEHQANDGTVLNSKSLATDFIDSPSAALGFGGMDALLRAQASDTANQLDAKIIPELRNFLVDGGPISDLGAINLKRGDDLGLPHYNEARAELGFQPLNSFNQFADQATANSLSTAYHGDLAAVDLFTGILAERDVQGGQLGQVGAKVIASTFSDLINGDRFWFENPTVGFTPAELKTIHDTSMSDLILRNTDTTDLQTSAFIALEREDYDLPQNKHLLQHEDNPVAKAALVEKAAVLPSLDVPVDPLQLSFLQDHTLIV